ncbi:MAG: CDP-diacylglycerol--serine O-phosphatidyltransferase, partial [Bacteroidia bacterium]|nr:CDP-diacylglycerol--serine O-phosphatidyltransferase [Bacteroidia bacterium]
MFDRSFFPNFVTCLNLLSGCLGITYCFDAQLPSELFPAVYCIFAGALFDFLDGFVARALKASSNIGKELDSLADLVTFGILPSMILWKLMPSANIVRYSVLVVPIFSAIRLAKFNLDTRQSERFIGLPTPANALFFTSFPYWFENQTWIFHPYLSLELIIPLTAILQSGLLISELPLFSLKFKNYQFSTNKIRYGFLFFSLILLFLFHQKSLAIIVFMYVFWSIF